MMFLWYSIVVACSGHLRSYNVCRLCSLHCIKQLRNYPGSAPYLATAFATCATGNAVTKLSFCYVHIQFT